MYRGADDCIHTVINVGGLLTTPCRVGPTQVPISITGIIGGAAVCVYVIGWIPALCGLAVAALILFQKYVMGAYVASACTLTNMISHSSYEDRLSCMLHCCHVTVFAFMATCVRHPLNLCPHYAVPKPSFYLTGIQGKVEQLTLELADERMSILTQIVETIKAIKFFAWEPEYLERITTVRNNECRKIREERMLHVTSVALGRASRTLTDVPCMHTL